MFKVGLKIAIVVVLAHPAFGADEPETAGLPVSELLQRASKSRLQPADVGLLRAVADLVEQEHAALNNPDGIPSPAIVEESDRMPQKRLVFHLRNVAVVDVAKALREFLGREMETEDSRREFQTLRQVVLVSEPVSNSLLISSDPKILDDLATLITRLDARPDMVSIEVLIAELAPAKGGTSDNDGAVGLPALEEDAAPWLARAKTQGRLNVLSRPTVMTLDNQPAFIQVGNRVPAIEGDGSSKEVNVGLILGVTPRVTPTGSVLIELDLERSAVINRQKATKPIIGKTTVQTTVSTRDGQTVVLGGMTHGTDKEPRQLIVALKPQVNPAQR